MILFGAEYEIANEKNLKNKFFRKQLTTKRKPIVDDKMLKKIDINLTLFNNEIKKEDFLLIGLIITEITEDQLKYNFFYCKKDELKQLGNGEYYANETEAGIPKIVHKNVIKKNG